MAISVALPPLPLPLYPSLPPADDAMNLVTFIDAARHYEALFGQSLFDQSDAEKANSTRLQEVASAALHRKQNAASALSQAQSHLQPVLRALSLRCDAGTGSGSNTQCERHISVVELCTGH